MSEIGDVIEYPGEVTFNWKIKDFFSLSDENSVFYLSPTIYFSGAAWRISIHPNSLTEKKSDVWISLYLRRMSHGSPIKLNCTFGFKHVYGKTVSELNFSEIYAEKYFSTGYRQFFKRSELIEKKSELAPKDILTIVCTLQNSQPNIIKRSLFRRLLNVHDNMLKIYQEGTRADFKLKFNEGQINAHRVILETRSEVFKAMLNHDTKENQSGEVFIDDVDKTTMGYLLQQIYCGEMFDLTTEKALSLYVAADKYDIKEVKRICLEYIFNTLSVESVCDVIKFAEFFEEKDLSSHAREYFKHNAQKILESEKWKIFARENQDLGIELLGSLVKKLLPTK